MTATHTRNQTRPAPTRAADLRPGHAVRIAGYGTLAVAALPECLPRGEILIRLGWERLALAVHPATPLDAYTGQPADTFKLWHCPRCGGSGLWLPEGTASNGAA